MDALTGLGNRLAFDESVAIEISRARRDSSAAQHRLSRTSTT